MSWLLVQSLCQRVITFFVFSFLARYLTKEDFGLASLCMLMITAADILINGGFAKGIIQKKYLDDTLLCSVFYVNVGLGVLLASALLGFSGVIGDYYSSPELPHVLSLLSIGLIVSSLSVVPRSILEKRLAFRELSVVAILSTIISSVVAVLLAVFDFGVWALVVQFLTFSLLSLFGFFIYTHWVPTKGLSFKALRSLLGFSAGALGSSVLTFVNRRTDHILITSHYGLEQLGVYTVAHKLFTTANDTFIVALDKWCFAKISKIGSASWRADCVTRSVLKGVILFLLPMFLYFSLNASSLVELIVGDKWIEAGPILSILAWVCVANCLYIPLRSRVLAGGYSILLFKIEFFGSILAVIGFLAVLDQGLQAMAFVFLGRLIFIVMPLVVFVYWKIYRDFVIGYMKAYISLLALVSFVFVFSITAFYWLNGIDFLFASLLWIGLYMVILISYLFSFEPRMISRGYAISGKFINF